MNNKTKIIIGVGAAAALLFFFRKQIFGGNGGSTEDSFVPDTSGPSETTEAPSETSGDTPLRPYVPPVVRPDIINVNPTTASPSGTVAPNLDSPLFFSAPSPTALGSM
jgi:hypothetical protein